MKTTTATEILTNNNLIAERDALAAVSNGLPAVMSGTLAKAARRLAKRNLVTMTSLGRGAWAVKTTDRSLW